MKWKFKEGVEVFTEEFWYDLTDGGYIKPAEILVDEEQVKQLEAAIELVRSFERVIDERRETFTGRVRNSSPAAHVTQADRCPDCKILRFEGEDTIFCCEKHAPRESC